MRRIRYWKWTVQHGCRRTSTTCRGGIAWAKRAYATTISGGRRASATADVARQHKLGPAVVTGLLAFGALGLLYLKFERLYPLNTDWRTQDPESKALAEVTGDKELDAMVQKVEVKGGPSYRPKLLSIVPIEVFLSQCTVTRVSEEKLTRVLPLEKANSVNRLVVQAERLLNSGKVNECVELCRDLVANLKVDVIGSSCERGYANFLLGQSLLLSGQYASARPYLLNAALYGHHGCKDRYLKVLSLNSLAVVSELTGDYGSSLRLLLAALGKDEVHKMMEESAEVDLPMESGRIASQRVRGGDQLTDEDLHALATIQTNIARICTRFREFEIAKVFACRALENCTAMESMSDERFEKEVVALLNLAEVHMAEGDMDFANRLFNRANDICVERGLQKEMTAIVQQVKKD